MAVAQKTRTFIPLEPAELNQVARDADASEMYLDSLALVDDMICELTPSGDHARIVDAQEIKSRLAEIHRQLPGFQDVKQNAIENLSVAEDLRTEALRLGKAGDRSRELDLSIEQFHDDLVEQYTTIARAY